MSRLTKFVVLHLLNSVASSAMVAVACWLFAFDDAMWAALQFGGSFAAVAVGWCVADFARVLLWD
jgi:hypothetical protein